MTATYKLILAQACTENMLDELLLTIVNQQSSETGSLQGFNEHQVAFWKGHKDQH